MKVKLPGMKDLESGKLGIEPPKQAEDIFNKLSEKEQQKVKRIVENKKWSYVKKLKKLTKIFKNYKQ